MTDYIKREDAIRAVAYENGDIKPTCDIESDIKALPSADVVEVVRCKDCKYWKELLPVCERIHRAGWGVNDFCSYGERAEE